MLKYLFKAEFSDGTNITQTQEDASVLEKGRNQWYDVLNSDKEVTKITYYEQKIWNPTVISVDLITGNFELNEVRVYSEPVKTKVKRKPVRFMLVQQHANATYNTKTGVFKKIKPIGEERIFYIGWEAGKQRQVIGVK